MAVNNKKIKKTNPKSKSKATSKRTNIKKNTTKNPSKVRDDIILLSITAISLILFISIYINKAGILGKYINKLIFGGIGVISFVIPFYLIGITLFKIANKGNELANKKIIYTILLIVVSCVIAELVQGTQLHPIRGIITHYNISSIDKVGGGIIGGFINDILLIVFGKWGTYVIVGITFILLLVLLTEKSLLKLLKLSNNKLVERIKNRSKIIQEKKVKKQENKQLEKNFTIENLEQNLDVKDDEATTKKNKSALDEEKIPINCKTEQLSFVIESETTNSKHETIEKESKKVNEKKANDKKDDVLQIDQTTKEKDYMYEFPSIDLLHKSKVTKPVISKQSIIENANKLQQTLENFGVSVKILNVSCGPSVTRYELQPEQGVKVSKIVSLVDDIKLNLAAQDVRIEAPIPGKAAVGIEVPNKDNQTVYLRDIIESNEFNKHPSKLAFAIGKDISGKVVLADIAKMPHLLIAGATGSGKSVCINTLIISIIYKAKPSDVKLIMVDPKMVELSVYNGIPHLMIPVVTDPKKASAALSWAVAEMTDRYKKFAEYNVRDLKGYNSKIEETEEGERLPQIVIIVDELADLMMVAPGDVEDAICRLAQMARAAGIHLVIATQRPSVNVITGLIKANVPSRIAFSVSSGVDSRTIIDMNGAEKLLGKGDMLFYPVGYQKPLRVQGAFISDKEVSDIVDYIAKNEEVTYNEDVIKEITSPSSEQVLQDNDKDEYFDEAVKLVVGKQKASISMLQRMFRIGFNRASRLMEQLHEAGIVGEDEGSKPRKVLVSEEENLD